MRHKIFITLTLALMIFLAACSPDPLAEKNSNIDRGAYATGVSQNTSTSGQWDSGFTLTVENDFQPMGLLVRGTTTRGNLTVTIQDTEGTIVWQSGLLYGEIILEETVESLTAGRYSVIVVWDGPVTATFDLYTVPGEKVMVPIVQPTALLGGGGMVLVGCGFLVYSAIKKLNWRFIGLGALAWVVTVTVKFAIAIPLNPVVYKVLVDPNAPGVGDWVLNLYIGILTGITEILMVWLVLRYTQLGLADWKRALGFGVGFGAIEAILLGISSFGSVLAALLAPAQIPLSTIEVLATGNHLLVGLAPSWERFFTLWIHILSNVLLFYGASTRSSRYFWMAFWFKSGIDTVAAYAQLTGLNSLGKMWLIEGIVALFGMVGYWGTQKIDRIYAIVSKETTPTPMENPIS